MASETSEGCRAEARRAKAGPQLASYPTMTSWPLPASARKNSTPDKKFSMTKARQRKSPRSAAKLSTIDALLKEDETLEEFQVAAID